jgi:hypothetical protein
MARENQGLQIALIILVILTIGLMVATFFGWKGYQEEFIRANEADKAKSDARATATSVQNEANELKRMMGFQDSDPLGVIQEEKENDMRDYAGTIDKNSQVYREVLKLLARELEQKESALSAELDAVQKLKTRNEGLERAKEQQIQVATKRADEAEADRDNERTAHNANRTQLLQQNQDLQARVAETRGNADEQLAAIQGKLDDSDRRLAIKDKLLVDKVKKLDDILKPTFEVADGKVQWVNQRAGTVWVNLGQADGLARQTSFAVYPSDTSDVTDAGSKGSIEVTQVHGSHLAEARIVDDTISDPIVPGDLIHTPVWAPGQRQHFALGWRIDIDDDDKSDLELVRNVITMNGGVVDFWLDDDGQRHGEMTTNTRYLVTGGEPGVNDKPEILRAFSEVNTLATEMGIRSMPLAELLARMGWTNQSPVVRYGIGAKASDFRAKPPEGVPRSSTGNVSQLYQFKDRKPPRSSGKSAY